MVVCSICMTDDVSDPVIFGLDCKCTQTEENKQRAKKKLPKKVAQYCRGCLEQWIQIHSASCPICRSKFGTLSRSKSNQVIKPFIPSKDNIDSSATAAEESVSAAARSRAGELAKPGEIGRMLQEQQRAQIAARVAEEEAKSFAEITRLQEIENARIKEETEAEELARQLYLREQNDLKREQELQEERDREFARKIQEEFDKKDDKASPSSSSSSSSLSSSAIAMAFRAGQPPSTPSTNNRKRNLNRTSEGYISKEEEENPESSSKQHRSNDSRDVVDITLSP